MIDTVNNFIYEQMPNPNCPCGLTSGCPRCNPRLFEKFYLIELKEKTWRFFKDLEMEETK